MHTNQYQLLKDVPRRKDDLPVYETVFEIKMKKDNLLALQRFTNRHNFIKRFDEYLNGKQSINKILFFHGDGGNGKSLLMKFLQENYCQSKSIPTALLDFGLSPKENNKPQDIFYGLLILRSLLAKEASGLKFPHYDSACAWYLYKTGKSLQEIKQEFPSEVINSVYEFVNSFFESSMIMQSISLLLKLINVNPQELWIKWRINGEWFKKLKAMDIQDIHSKLIYKLPEYFAKDLNQAMTEEKAPERIVLFFDSHEVFWGEQRDLKETLFFEKDEWLRRLLNSLDLSKGIVVVVAGREPPRWADSPKFPISHTKLDIQALGHLSKKDAKIYLQKADISDAQVQSDLIDYASAMPDQVHPLLLSLYADVIRTTNIDSKELISNNIDIVTKTKEVFNRLLQYVDKDIEYAIYALIACRHFDSELYFKLGEALHFEAYAASFDTLTQFSFVWSHENKYRIHDLLRRYYKYGNKSRTQEAHVFLETYYRNKKNLPEAIYHRISHDRMLGMKKWLEVFYHAKKRGDLELCRTLRQIRTETSLYLDR